MSKKDWEKSTAHTVLKYGTFPNYQICRFVVKSIREYKKNAHFKEAELKSINVANGFLEDILVRVDTAIVYVSDVTSIEWWACK